MQVVAQIPFVENNHNDDDDNDKKINKLFVLQFYQIVTWKKESSTGHGTLKLLF